MNSRIGDFTEDAFEKGQQVVKQSVKSVVNAVTSQVAGSSSQAHTSPADTAPHGQDAQPSQDDKPNELSQLEQNVHQQTTTATQSGDTSSHGQKKPKGDIHAKTPEEEAQMEAVRKKLWHEQHMETYYNPTFNPPKQKDEPVAEKLEREKQEEMMELQQKEAKKPQPMAVQQAQQSTEKFRGASG